MNIFVAGIHGVGKTFLASRAAPNAGLLHTSASKLIREERTSPTWGSDKRVTDVDANQIALATAIKRHNEVGTRLLLDGHFVLLDGEGEMIHLGADVFSSLSLSRVLLIEADVNTVAQRIEGRDQRQVSIDHLQAFMEAERNQAQKVCAEIHIPLAILLAPSVEEFLASINNFGI